MPSDAATLSEAMELVIPGGIVIVAPGEYHEQLLVNKPDVTIRGEDRNASIIDGGGIRPYGIVVTADGVRVENLTVTGATFYGVLVTGMYDGDNASPPVEDNYSGWDPSAFPPLQRFLIDHVTAYNNGLYGIYALNSQHGVIRDSYTSGSADSGIYVGQCVQCDTLVTANVSERNAVGFENANASDSLVIVGNRFSGNRIGMTLLTSYREAFTPQRANTVVGNLISDNTEADSPSQANGGFAIGIGIAGGQDNTVLRNRITGNPRAAVELTNTEDIPALRNRFTDNLVDDGVTVSNLSVERTPAVGNCWAAAVRTVPEALAAELSAACDEAQLPQSSAENFIGPTAPPGVSFRTVSPPRSQPQLAASANYERLPDAVTFPALDGFPVPGAQLLADRSGTR